MCVVCKALNNEVTIIDKTNTSFKHLHYLRYSLYVNAGYVAAGIGDLAQCINFVI